MENYIRNKKEIISQLITQLQQEKQSSDFTGIVKKRHDNKREIRIAKTASRSMDDSKEVKLTLEHNEELKKENAELEKQIENVSKISEKLYHIEKEIMKKIVVVDKKKNNHDFAVRKLNLELDFNLSVLSGKRNELLQAEVEKHEKSIIENDKLIEELKNDKVPYVLPLRQNIYSKGVIKKHVKEINKNLATSAETLNERNEVLKAKISKAEELAKTEAKDLEDLVSLKTMIDDEFKLSKSVNNEVSFTVKHLDVWYGSKQALFDINLELPKNKVISIIGPSGCGKSTFLRTLNRINDNIPSFKARGRILLDGEYDIYKLRSINNYYDKMELPTLRTKVGMIFQQPNPFPMSIAKNVQYGPKIKGIKNKVLLNELTEQSLKDAGIWEEVKDNLKALGTSLSGGQQQRLCIARAIANEPEILLMDEPTSALDPIATKIIEDLIVKLKKHYTIIMVTHSMQQAQRISDYTAYFYQGEMIEFGETKQVFENPKNQATKDYITGKFG